MSTEDIEPDGGDGRRDRREHAGASAHPDDEALARRTEAERVDAGLDDYDPNDVSAATDEPPQIDLTDTDEYQEAAAEARREVSEGELGPEAERQPFPPSHYDRS